AGGFGSHLAWMERGLAERGAALRAKTVGDVARELAGFDAQTRGEAPGAGRHAQAAVFQEPVELFADSLPFRFVHGGARQLDREDEAALVRDEVEDAHARAGGEEARGFVARAV